MAGTAGRSGRRPKPTARKALARLEEENRKLKQIYADLALDNRILRDVIEKNSVARDKEADSGRDFRGIPN